MIRAGRAAGGGIWGGACPGRPAPEGTGPTGAESGRTGVGASARGRPGTRCSSPRATPGSSTPSWRPPPRAASSRSWHARAPRSASIGAGPRSCSSAPTWRRASPAWGWPSARTCTSSATIPRPPRRGRCRWGPRRSSCPGTPATCPHCSPGPGAGAPPRPSSSTSWAAAAGSGRPRSPAPWRSAASRAGCRRCSSTSTRAAGESTCSSAPSASRAGGGAISLRQPARSAI